MTHERFVFIRARGDLYVQLSPFRYDAVLMLPVTFGLPEKVLISFAHQVGGLFRRRPTPRITTMIKAFNWFALSFSTKTPDQAPPKYLPDSSAAR
jgi:hypothetical protein